MRLPAVDPVSASLPARRERAVASEHADDVLAGTQALVPPPVGAGAAEGQLGLGEVHLRAVHELEDDQLLLQTFRSHDQFNTTIYGTNDRYRGIKNERRVIFMNSEDMQARGIVAEQPIDITSHFEGETRTAELFLAIPYDTPKGCAAAYYPEANVLVPIAAQAAHSGTPASKSVIVTVSPHN